MRKTSLTALIAAGNLVFAGFSVADSTQMLTVSATDCRRLVRHQPAPDVTYQPGLDVHGKAVAPADLDGGYPQVEVPEQFTFEITAKLKEYLVSAQAGRFSGEAILGRVTVKGDKVYFNGQLLGDAAAHAIAEECKRIQQGKDQ